MTVMIRWSVCHFVAQRRAYRPDSKNPRHPDKAILRIITRAVLALAVSRPWATRIVSVPAKLQETLIHAITVRYSGRYLASRETAIVPSGRQTKILQRELKFPCRKNTSRSVRANVSKMCDEIKMSEGKFSPRGVFSPTVEPEFRRFLRRTPSTPIFCLCFSLFLSLGGKSYALSVFHFPARECNRNKL